MTLFDSSSVLSPQPLACELIISPDNDNGAKQGAFRPGDNINGTVSLIIRTEYPVRVQSCQLALSGSSSSYIRQSRSSSNANGHSSTDHYHFRDFAQFLTVTTQLLQDVTVLSPNEVYQRPFNFVFPRGTADGSGNQHELPPSCAFTHDWAGVSKCCIAYGLEATVFPADTSTQPSCTSIPLPFVPSGPSNGADNPLSVSSGRFRCASSMLSNSSDDKDASSWKLSRFQRMKDHMRSQTPHIDISLHCTLPQTLVPGQPFAITPFVRIHDRSEGVQSIPPITFRFKKLKLKGLATWRAPRDWNASNTMKEAEACEQVEVQLNAVSNSKDGTATRRQVNVGEKKNSYQGTNGLGPSEGDIYECGFSARAPGDSIISFHSFAIALGYRLKFEMVALVAGKEFKFEESAGVGMLAPPQRGSQTFGGSQGYLAAA